MSYAEKHKELLHKLEDIDSQIAEHKTALQSLEEKRKEVYSQKEKNSMELMMQNMKNDCQSADEMLETLRSRK